MNCLDCKHCGEISLGKMTCNAVNELIYEDEFDLKCNTFEPNKEPIPSEKPDRHAAICSELNELYRRKNADYGDSFGRSWDEEGYHAFTVRGGDKMNRIKQLFKNEAQVSDESIIDTLRDLANYSIMAIIELEARK